MILAHGSVLKAVGMILVGMLLGTVGIDVNTSVPRYTFGIPQFGDGMDFAVIAMGIFGIGETIINLERTGTARAYMQKIGNLWPRLRELKAMIAPASRGTLLGSALGILPGGGPVLAAFSAYALEKKVSRTPERFGKGALEGVAGPEAANNGAAQTSFIPLLTLGVPANAVMALMVGALMMHGLHPGPQLMRDKPELFWGLIASMWTGNLIPEPAAGGHLGQDADVPYRFLYPAVLIICCIGVYSVNNSALDVLIAAMFGLVGYLLYRLNCEPAPLLLGFILGPLIEENLRRALVISHGSPTVFIERPISATFLVLTGVLILVLAAPMIRAGRERVFREEQA